MYHVKVKPPERKSWWFLSTDSRLNRLRIHALLVDDRERAERYAAEIKTENEGYDAKVVSAEPRKRRL
jgi:hypothetical protein